MPVELSFYTPAEAAKELGVSTDRVYDLCRQGIITHVRRSPRRIMIPKRTFDAWRNAGEVHVPSVESSAMVRH